VEVDVRIVAATNQNLEELVRAGKFRSDLYHRLTQFQLTIPPLRERTEDVIGIAEYVLKEHFPNSRFTPDAMQVLLSYGWPGNVRELKNVIFKAVLQGKNAEREIAAADLPISGGTSGTQAPGAPTADLNEMERQMILKALESAGGNQGQAAQKLGISRRTLSRKLKIYRSERENAIDSLPGSLSSEQKRYYRATVNETATLIVDREEHRVKLVNLSMGGAAVLAHLQLKPGCAVYLRFHLPGTDQILQITGAVAWAESDGQHGIQFRDIPAHLHTHLERWLLMRMESEGWQAPHGD
jgi:hypothetical protein